MKKRGLSNVVATVLIVLLALAAIAIVWGFISPALRDSGTEIGTAAKCLNVELRPTTCTFTAGSPPTMSTTIKLSRGDAEKLKVITEDDEGNRNVSATFDAPPTTLDSTSITSLNISNIATAPYKVSVVAVFINDNGEEAFCTESSTVTCTEA